MSTYTVLKVEFDINGTKSSRAGRQGMLFCCPRKVRNKAELSHITLNGRNLLDRIMIMLTVTFQRGSSL